MAKRKYPKKGTKAYALRSEYKRLEKNLKRRIENAIKSGRLPQPAKIPNEPKRITEASIRKIKRLSESFWRGPKKEAKPLIDDAPGISSIDQAVYDNFLRMVEEAVEWAGELYDWVERWIAKFPHLQYERNFIEWIKNVNKSGKNVKKLSNKCLKNIRTEIGKNAGFHIYVERIEALYRDAYDEFELYLHGYQAPEDGIKAAAFITITNILGHDILPAEKELIYNMVMRNNEDETLEIYE